jgi:hypothetical protein
MFYKKFYSELFERYILPEENDFNSFVKAELLFRIDKMKDENCSCMKCMTDLKKFIEYFQNLKETEKANY